MAHLFTFTSGRFSRAQEPPNPINDIGGHGVLAWLAAELRRLQIAATDPDAEDWGWYSSVTADGVSYLLGASGEWEDADAGTRWVVQLERHRSLWDKVSGANKLESDDALSMRIEALLRDEPEFSVLLVERDG
ncbi:MAG: hypothetical protein V4617_03645 [Gemmatimonadota bacterium]